MRIMPADPHYKISSLEAQNEKLRKENERYRLRTEYLENKMKVLEARIAALLHRIYGRRTERLDPAQLLLFGKEGLEPSPETPAGLRASDAMDFEQAPKRRSRGRGRKPLPKDLPRERRVHDPEPSALVCPGCGKSRVRIGEEVTEELEYIPAQLFVIEHVRGKYACPKCQEGVAIADLPARPIEKGRPGAGLLAHVVISKYGDHLPLYRQEKIFARQGVDLPRSTLCDWVGWVADLCSPIVKEMKRGLFESVIIQSDDTPVRVMDPERKGKAQKAFLWSYCAPGGEVVFDFTLRRSRDGPVRFLAGFEGYLQADGYEGYNAALRGGKMTHIGCMAHVRRKFYAALDESPEYAGVALAAIRELYLIERGLKENGADATSCVTLRKDKALPILKDLEDLFRELKGIALPQSELGKALSYALNQWPAIKRYTEVGEAEIDNNGCENTIRGVAVGRKNWLFCGHPNGGDRAAILYSLIESCKRVGVEPFAYLKDILDRVATHPSSRIRELTPRGWKEARSTD
jgi:transposase